MIILGVETSCDETALSIIEAGGTLEKPTFKVLANAVLSQIKIHQKHGGVFPMLAKREHAKNLLPLFKCILEEVGYLNVKSKVQNVKLQLEIRNEIKIILKREPELLKQFLEFMPNIKTPPIDYIAVTHGPGLEPTLWVGINFAKALQEIWKVPIIPINHMEGHVVASLLNESKGGQSVNPVREFVRGIRPRPCMREMRPTASRGTLSNGVKLESLEFPALALLISGGHTELVLVEGWGKYKIVGETRDDAVGEAYDKVGRMLSVPYPAGPEINRLAIEDRTKREVGDTYKFPRPMIHSDDLDFSFSGLKTSVLYTMCKIKNINEDVKREIAREFEDAVLEVLTAKTLKALEKYSVRTVIISGGVSANMTIRSVFEKMSKEKNFKLLIPPQELSTDNALMIATAGFVKTLIDTREKESSGKNIRAEGNLRLAS